MTAPTKSSPLPLGIERTGDYNWIGPLRENGKVDDVWFHNERGDLLTKEASDRNDERADLIVKAVNSHDELVTTLNQARAWINGGNERKPKILMARIDAALSLAKEGA
jgi:hypothetical protein